MTYIKNYKELNSSEKRERVLEMIEAGIKAISPETLLFQTVKYNDDFNSVIVHNDSFDMLSGRIFVVGAGKAVGKMAEAFEKVVGEENITAGVVNTGPGEYDTKKIKINIAGHPLPDEQGVKGVYEILELKEKYNIGKKDLLVNLLSGGASSMMVLPKEGISLKEKQKTTQVLIECGATIQEINTVRKHISGVKGGQLAKYFEPAQVLSLIISDVVGHDAGVIGSGPTVADESTFIEAIKVIEKYEISGRLPESVTRYLEKGSRKVVLETPKKLKNASNYIIGKSSTALEAMAFEAKNMGLKPLIVTVKAIGQPIELASWVDRQIIEDEYDGIDVLLLAGEVTPQLPKSYGQGGRNQHFVALNMVGLPKQNKEWAMASVASDGRDYFEGVAGAIIDQDSLAAYQDKVNVGKYLLDFDTYSMFEQIPGALIKMDSTGTNVGDLIVYHL